MILKFQHHKVPTHYSGNGDVLDIVVHKNVRLSQVIVSDMLDSDHLPIIFHLLDHIRSRNLSDPVDKLQIENGFNAWPLN
jgi:hypothetical protein